MMVGERRSVGGCTGGKTCSTGRPVGMIKEQSVDLVYGLDSKPSLLASLFVSSPHPLVAGSGGR